MNVRDPEIIVTSRKFVGDYDTRLEISKGRFRCGSKDRIAEGGRHRSQPWFSHSPWRLPALNNIYLNLKCFIYTQHLVCIKIVYRLGAKII